MEKDRAALIGQAFEKARTSGRSDWRFMTVAVLKNRILDLTQRRFHERQFGAETFLDFVRGASDMVRIDETRSPALVEFVGEPAPGASIGRRDAGIRPDLWRAVMDYSSKRTFVWDGTEGLAREIREGESDAFVLPTVTAETLNDWRAGFCSRFSETGTNTATLVRLETWQKGRLPSSFLPGPLRGDWNEELKTRVEKRLREWFSRKAVEPPADLVTDRTPATAGDRDDRRIEALRALVLACVQEMTERELAELPLPASAVLRVRTGRT